MSGLVKAKKYDWKDSNLALFGSDTEREVKKASAQTEPAWNKAGEKVGMQIWRIVKFKVTHWPKEDYGRFFNGDSYILLNTYKEAGGDELKYDLHFWIGEYSTQDEYGTAAYKTVELDTLLDDKPIQHREVMDHESALFKTYFKCIELLEGGADTGFRHVKPVEYTPRLLHFHGDRKGVSVRERPLNKHSLRSSDVFILDLGLKIYQWNGKQANKDERFKAAQYLQALRSERNGKPEIEGIDEHDCPQSHEFYTTLSEDPLDEDEETDSEDFKRALFKLSDESGSMNFTLVDEGKLNKSNLSRKDVFILDSGSEVFVWIGNAASKAEKHNAMSYAHKYLQGTQHPCVPVTILRDGTKNAAFEMLFT